MPTKSFAQRYPLVLYFGLAYGITWGDILIYLSSKGFQLSAIRTPDVLVMFLLMLLGPSLGGLLSSGILSGRAGLAEVWQRLTTVRVGWPWYAIALLTNPLLYLAILWVLSTTVSTVFKPSVQLAGLAIGLMAGGFEEIGWTGFATPRLLARRGVLKAGVTLGVIWALWHMLADFAGNISTLGAAWPLVFILFWILPLTAYRILMTWVYSHTHSIFVAQLMHASYTGWLLALSPATNSQQALLWQIALAAGLWGLVALVTYPDGHPFWARPIRAVSERPPRTASGQSRTSQ
jgi:membrane protease YdiL (CAAX protease family)